MGATLAGATLAGLDLLNKATNLEAIAFSCTGRGLCGGNPNSAATLMGATLAGANPGATWRGADPGGGTWRAGLATLAGTTLLVGQTSQTILAWGGNPGGGNPDGAGNPGGNGINVYLSESKERTC